MSCNKPPYEWATKVVYGLFRLALKYRATKLSLWVADSGQGIKPECLQVKETKRCGVLL